MTLKVSSKLLRVITKIFKRCIYFDIKFIPWLPVYLHGNSLNQTNGCPYQGNLSVHKPSKWRFNDFDIVMMTTMID